MVDRFRQIQGAQTFHRTAPLPGNGLHTSPSKIGSARLHSAAADHSAIGIRGTLAPGVPYAEAGTAQRLTPDRKEKRHGQGNRD